jgi:serine/threonine protein kinase
MLERAFAALVRDERDDQGVVAHVEGCPVCQSRLEALMADGNYSPRGGQPPEAGRESRPSASDQTSEGRSAPDPGEGARVPEVPGYEILGRLGRGGMGVVWKARHRKLNRVVALKMVLAGEHAEPGHLARFHLEAEAVARLRHPNIVAIYDVGTAGGIPYIALEYLEGGTLEQMAGGGPQPARLAAEVVAALARGVHTAHLAGIVHRDLKPANVLLSHAAPLADIVPKVTDFGLAKRLEGQGHTQTGQIIGTPAYMAPEQARGESKNVGPAADIYALGAILYELLTGQPPFRSEALMETLAMVLHDEPASPRKLLPTVPADLETVCLKTLRKDPAERYPTAQELADELDRFLHDEPVRARPLRRVERAYRWCRRNPTLAGLLAVAAGLLLTLGVVGMLILYQLRLQAARAGEEIQRERAEDALARARRYLYLNRIYLADRAYHDNQMARARQLLKDCQSDDTGWEWQHLNRITRAELLTAAGHADAVHALAFSPRGEWLASGGADRTLLFWKPGSERAFQRWDNRHSAPIWGVAISADGRRLASVAGSARKAGELIVWDVTSGPGPTGRELFPRVGGTGEQAAVAFHPGKPLLARPAASWPGSRGACD